MKKVLILMLTMFLVPAILIGCAEKEKPLEEMPLSTETSTSSLKAEVDKSSRTAPVPSSSSGVGDQPAPNSEDKTPSEAQAKGTAPVKPSQAQPPISSGLEDLPSSSSGPEDTGNDSNPASVVVHEQEPQAGITADRGTAAPSSSDLEESEIHISLVKVTLIEDPVTKEVDEKDIQTVLDIIEGLEFFEYTTVVGSGGGIVVTITADGQEKEYTFKNNDLVKDRQVEDLNIWYSAKEGSYDFLNSYFGTPG